jgi:sterol desaturase/sphingolipid hydroxylase (fatty acid hydroxylase superfamily)
LPTHPLAAGLWLFYMTFMNVAGHLGYEFLPRGFASHRVFRWHNTPLHHNMHHSRVHCNFGLYFNLWDRLMGTNHPHYEDEYERCTAGEFVESDATNRTHDSRSAPIDVALPKVG